MDTLAVSPASADTAPDTRRVHVQTPAPSRVHLAVYIWKGSGDSRLRERGEGREAAMNFESRIAVEEVLDEMIACPPVEWWMLSV